MTSQSDAGQPEYLDQGGGGPLTGQRSPGSRRRALLAGATVVGLAVVGAGAWAAVSFFSTGPQPAEALPASTLAYASVDLDPSGGQKLEALRGNNMFFARATVFHELIPGHHMQFYMQSKDMQLPAELRLFEQIVNSALYKPGRRIARNIC